MRSISKIANVRDEGFLYVPRARVSFHNQPLLRERYRGLAEVEENEVAMDQ